MSGLVCGCGVEWPFANCFCRFYPNERNGDISSIDPRKSVSEASVEQSGQEADLFILQVHFRKIVVKYSATRNEFLHTNVDVKRASILRQRNKFWNPEPSMGF